MAVAATDIKDRANPRPASALVGIYDKLVARFRFHRAHPSLVPVHIIAGPGASGQGQWAHRRTTFVPRQVRPFVRSLVSGSIGGD